MKKIAEKSLDRKLNAILKKGSSCKEFIIADAKDADMAFGITAPGYGEGRWKNLEEYRRQIREVVKQGLVDIMLCSASNIEALGIVEKIFQQSPVTPAARANDTSDIWVVRGGRYVKEPSKPFRTANMDHIMYGKLNPKQGARMVGADLGLYSMTFTNDLNRDHETLTEFKKFREEAEQKKFRYFLEVFDPNVDAGIPGEEIPSFINDHIIRALAGVPHNGRPLFLKIAYHGPRALDELVSYDPGLVVGILGGASGTTYDAFKLISEAQKYGARVALFGRKINLSESPLTFIKMLRSIVNGEITPEEAVKLYHHQLSVLNIKPKRPLKEDLVLTDIAMSYGGKNKS